MFYYHTSTIGQTLPPRGGLTARKVLDGSHLNRMQNGFRSLQHQTPGREFSVARFIARLLRRTELSFTFDLEESKNSKGREIRQVVGWLDVQLPAALEARLVIRVGLPVEQITDEAIRSIETDVRIQFYVPTETNCKLDCYATATPETSPVARITSHPIPLTQVTPASS